MANLIIDAFDPDTVSVARVTGPTTYVKGVPIQASASTLSVIAVVTPVNQQDINLLPEGFEERESYVFYTETELFAAREAGKTPADVITYRGRDFVVMSVRDRYQISDLAHYRAVASLRDA